MGMSHSDLFSDPPGDPGGTASRNIATSLASEITGVKAAMDDLGTALGSQEGGVKTEAHSNMPSESPSFGMMFCSAFFLLSYFITLMRLCLSLSKIVTSKCQNSISHFECMCVCVVIWFRC